MVQAVVVKFPPKVLEKILHSEMEKFVDSNLLVGNETKDDAAVYDIGNGIGIISTTDFFMPIVDDPFDFGRIAATNAISDIFAMGGKPIMAIAILGFPIKLLPAEVAQRIVDGGRFACQQAGIALAGGHSIDAPEPIFGLAVTGIIKTEKVKKNASAQEGCKLSSTLYFSLLSGSTLSLMEMAKINLIYILKTMAVCSIILLILCKIKGRDKI